MMGLWCSKMVRRKIRLALTVLIVLALCAGLVISTADAKSGTTSGKTSGKTTGKAATTSFNAAATNSLSATATPAIGASVFGLSNSISGNIFGTSNNLVQATPTGSFVNSFGQSFSPGVTSTNTLMTSATPFTGSNILSNALTQADNIFATTNDQAFATPMGSQTSSFGQSFVPGITNTGNAQALATLGGVTVTSDTNSIV